MKYKKYFEYVLLIIILIISGCSQSRYGNIARKTVFNQSKTILLDKTITLQQEENTKTIGRIDPLLEKDYAINKENEIDSPIVDPSIVKPEKSNYKDTAQTNLSNDSTLVNINSETKKTERLVNMEYGFCMAACIALLLALISILPLIVFSIEIFLDLCIMLVCLFIITSMVFGVIAFAKMKLLELELKNGKKLLKSFIINLLLIFLPIISIILAQLFLY